MNDIDLFLEVV